MFDDVLSGLDMKTEEQLFIRVFGPDGLLRQHNITTVLVTHRGSYDHFSRQLKANLFQCDDFYMHPKSLLLIISGT